MSKEARRQMRENEERRGEVATQVRSAINRIIVGLRTATHEQIAGLDIDVLRAQVEALANAKTAMSELLAERAELVREAAN